jgi:hypothetical protein
MDAIFGGSESVILGTGATLHCGDLFVEMRHASGAVERVELVRPGAGVGGTELVVSPDERFAALFVYSGQSEQGYELFELSPMLRHVGGLPYVYGTGMAPVFSPDSRYLAMVVAAEWRTRATGEHAETLFDGSAGAILVDWGWLHVHAIPDGPVTSVPLGTLIERTFDVDTSAEWDLHELPAFVAPDRLAIGLPWGARVLVDVPPRGPVTTPRPPRA